MVKHFCSGDEIMTHFLMMMFAYGTMTQMGVDGDASAKLIFQYGRAQFTQFIPTPLPWHISSMEKLYKNIIPLCLFLKQLLSHLFRFRALNLRRRWFESLKCHFFFRFRPKIPEKKGDAHFRSLPLELKCFFLRCSFFVFLPFEKCIDREISLFCFE